MLIIFTRAIIVYIFLLISMRVMGKKQLGELQPFEFAITLIVADLACIPMGDTTVPITYGLAPIFTLLILHIFLNKLNKRSIKVRRIVNGKPVIIIDENGLNAKALASLDMTIHDVMEAIRTAGYFNLADIRFAIVETNGNVTVMPKAGCGTASLADLGIEKPEPNLPFTVVCEGKIMDANLSKSGFSLENVEKVLKHFQMRAKDVLIFTVTDKNDIFLQGKRGAAISATVREVLGGSNA